MSSTFHNIFEKYKVRWQNTVVRYARSLWNNSMTDEKEEHYNNQAVYFSKEYRHAMEKYYAEKGMKVYKGTLSGYVYEWLKKQDALKDTLKQVAADKKDKLITDALEKLKDTKDAQKVIDKLYGAKENETVYKVFSFKENFEAFSKQHGDEEAYGFGTGLNEKIIQQFSDRYFWKTQKDKKVRDTHMQLQGKCFLFADPPTTVDKYGNKYTGNPGTDYGCVPEGTLIRLDSDVIRCFRRKYTGELIQFISESGITLSATVNHPILTQSGWKPAHLLNIGDYVFKVPDKSVQRSETDIYDTGIPIEKIFDFFSLCGNQESVSGTTSQFHGDGIPEEKVDIITTKRVLTDKINPFTGEKISKLVFSDPDVMAFHHFGTSEGEVDSPFFWLGLSFLGDMGGGGDCFSLFGSGILKANDVSLTAVSSFDSIELHQEFNRTSPMSSAEIFDSASNGTHPGFITFDDFKAERIIDIKTTFYNGHVYNLQTSTSWYIANGLSIHNCRCWAELAPEREKPLRNYTVYEKVHGRAKKH